MVTLPGEAADDPELVAGLVDAGMDVARINCAHDGPDAWARMIAHVQASSAAADRRVLVSMDLAGPKLLLKTGDRLVLTTDLTPVQPPTAGETARIGCTSCRCPR